MKQSIALLILVISVISIFSYQSISQFANATSDQTKISPEFCYNENPNKVDCNNPVIHQTGAGYFSLMLVKEVVGGPASPDDFSLTVGGNPVLSGQENFYSVDAVLHIDETQQPDYIFSSITGDGCPTQLNESFTLTQDTVCTITNIHCDDPVSLTVIKEVVGGSASPDDFALTVDGNSRVSGQISYHGTNTVLSIGETQQPNYFFSSITGNGCPTNLYEDFTLTQDTVCTITNTFDSPTTLTVIKTIVNDDGGTLTIAGVDLKIDGTSVTNGTVNGVSAGAHTVSETAISGYIATIGGDCDAAGSITVALGEDAVCTITNDDVTKDATLTVIKTIVNDDGGTLTIAGVDLKIDGTSVTNGTVNGVSAGAHTVSETAISGYIATIGGDCDAAGSITVALGEDAVCTITNDDVTKDATLTVIKTIVNDDGGTLTIAGVDLKIDGTSVTNGTVNGVSAGAHTVSETAISGYIATIGGDCDAAGSITVALGEDAVCTITNDDVTKDATLTVIKTIVNDDGGTLTIAGVDLKIDGTSVTNGTVNGVSAGAHTVSETAISGYIATIGGDCDAAGSITVALGEDAVCTITNDDVTKDATLTVIKTIVNDDGGTLTIAGVDLKIDGTSVTNGTVNGVSAGAHTVSETAISGYIATIGGDCDAAGSITVALGEDAVCTITNDDVTKDATLTVIKTIVNDDGGTLTIAGVDLKIDGTSVTNGTVNGVSAGAHTVSETAISGYIATIGGDCDAAGSITVALGEDAVCTITNDDVTKDATLTVIKEVVNGTASPGDFNLTVDDDLVLSGQTLFYGTNTVLSISETQQPDYFFSIITGDGCPTQLDEFFTLTRDTVCTIKNIFYPEPHPPPVSLKVIVKVIDDSAAPEDFILIIDNSPRISNQTSKHIVNTKLVVEDIQPSENFVSISGDDDCPQNLNESFTLTEDTECTIFMTSVGDQKGGGGGGGHEEWDTRPTFGLSHETLETLLVDNGFSFNEHHFSINETNHHHPFDEKTIEIGVVNTFEATVLADKGLKVQEFLFGIPNVGKGHLAELGVEIWFDTDGKIDDVKIFQEDPVIDISRLTISHEKSKCLEKDSDDDKKCDSTKIEAVFLETLEHKVMAIKAIDFKLRDQTTYLNDGFGISGSSLNPMKTMEIPSNLKGEGLITVTQTEKYSPYWISENGRMFEKNNFDSFKQIDINFERFQDTGTAYTRQHSEFGRVMEYEQKRALQLFNATELISELPESFSHDILIQERINDEVKGTMITQEQIAREFLETNNVQARW